MTPVTIWLQLRQPLGTIRGETSERRFIFNHIEDGHVLGERPVPRSKAQQKWRRGEWRRIHGHLTDDPIPRLVSPEPFTTDEEEQR